MKNLVRIGLGLMMIAAGIGHLSFVRKTFQAQVPDWVPMSKDSVVLSSGVVEILLGLTLIFFVKKKEHVGLGLAIFFVLIFPGNIAQYLNHRDGFGLNTDGKRLARLFFQPVLIFLTMYSTDAFQLLKSDKNKTLLD